MSMNQDDKTADLRQAERDRLFRLPDFPHERPDDETGVLLSDRIKYYCQKEYQLITPFDPNLLRPAGYDLTVGRNYSKGGHRQALNDGMELEIGPYQVAIIETYETLNIPQFLIGRWNIRVQLAYAGLLWVGGAQVDPGFRGHLCCPIYNLSTKPVTLKFRQKLAMIDFVTTTTYTEGECETFDWRNRRMLVFADYPGLSSGIEEQVDHFKQTMKEAKDTTQRSLTEAAKSTDLSLRDIHRRIDTFLALVFTVVAVLFTGLGIIATTRPDERSFINPPAWVAAVALYFALRARSSDAPAPKEQWYSRPAAALAIAGTVVFASLAYHAWDAHVSFKDLREAKEQASQAANALAKEKQDREAAIQQVRQESDAKLDNLRQQLKSPQPSQSKTK